MKKSRRPKKKDTIYQAPIAFVGAFYVLLAAWTVFCVILLGIKTLKIGWPVGQLLMIAFILAYTWYFSLGITYKLRLTPSDELELTSFRRILNVDPQQVSMVEGPRLRFPFGFARFKLAREKIYLFCVLTNPSLQEILQRMNALNPNMKLKYL